MKDLTKQPKIIKEKYDKVIHLIKDIIDFDHKEVIISAQTPLREKLGLPPMEIKNTIEGALTDLKTISDIHKKKEGELNGIS